MMCLSQNQYETKITWHLRRTRQSAASGRWCWQKNSYYLFSCFNIVSLTVEWAVVRLSVVRIFYIVGCLYFIVLSHVYWKKGETEHEIKFSSMVLCWNRLQIKLLWKIWVNAMETKMKVILQSWPALSTHLSTSAQVGNSSISSAELYILQLSSWKSSISSIKKH